MARPSLRVIAGEPDPAKRQARLAARGYSAGASVPLAPPPGRAKTLTDDDLTPADVQRRRASVLDYLCQVHSDDGFAVRDALAYAADLVALEAFPPAQQDPSLPERRSSDAPGPSSA